MADLDAVVAKVADDDARRLPGKMAGYESAVLRTKEMTVANPDASSAELADMTSVCTVDDDSAVFVVNDRDPTLPVTLRTDALRPHQLSTIGQLRNVLTSRTANIHVADQHYEHPIGCEAQLA